MTKRTFNALQQLYGFKQKGRVTVMEATMTAFEKMPKVFNGTDLHRIAARELMRPSVYPDTIFRSMRLLKKRGKLWYFCIDYVNSIYQKGDRP
jgi:hypothetical protein